MSSDFLAFEDPFYAPQFSNAMPVFSSDPFSALSDSSIDSLLQISEDPNPAIGASEAQSLEQMAQFETLSLYQQTQFAHLQNSPDFPSGFVDSPVSGVNLGFDSPPITNSYFSGVDTFTGEGSMANYLQRSYSHQPAFSALPENAQVGGHIRRVLSTGDLPMKTGQTASPSNLGSKSSTAAIFMEEPSFKVAKYSAEERKERIERYRAKRSLRNFNKTIKYSCRKTLADSRPRIRGRFARNDEPVARAKSAAGLNRDEDEDELLWGEGLIHGGGDPRGHFMDTLGVFDQGFVGY